MELGQKWPTSDEYAPVTANAARQLVRQTKKAGYRRNTRRIVKPIAVAAGSHNPLILRRIPIENGVKYNHRDRSIAAHSVYLAIPCSSRHQQREFVPSSIAPIKLTFRNAGLWTRGRLPAGWNDGGVFSQGLQVRRPTSIYRAPSVEELHRFFEAHGAQLLGPPLGWEKVKGDRYNPGPNVWRPMPLTRRPGS
jgi:hypothetical protein